MTRHDIETDIGHIVLRTLENHGWFYWRDGVLVSFADGELDSTETVLGAVILLLSLLLRCRRPLVETDVPADGPEVSGDQLTHVEVVLVVTEGVFNGLGHLKPTDEEDKSEDEEERDVGGDVGFLLQGLTSDEREEEVTPKGKPHDLSVERGQDHTVESVHRLQLSLEFGNLVN